MRHYSYKNQLLAPTWTRDLRKLLTSHVHQAKQYNVTLQTPSTSVVFTKYPPGYGQLMQPQGTRNPLG